MKIPRENIYILNKTGRIDLKRSPKEYLDLKDEIQRSVNKNRDKFPVNHETHVEPVVNFAFKTLTELKASSSMDECQVYQVEIGNTNLFFSFGLPPGANGITIK